MSGKLTTNAIITTNKGKEINLGVIDKRFTPRLWFYKYVTYKIRSK